MIQRACRNGRNFPMAEDSPVRRKDTGQFGPVGSMREERLFERRVEWGKIKCQDFVHQTIIESIIVRCKNLLGKLLAALNSITNTKEDKTKRLNIGRSQFRNKNSRIVQNMKTLSVQTLQLFLKLYLENGDLIHETNWLLKCLTFFNFQINVDGIAINVHKIKRKSNFFMELSIFFTTTNSQKQTKLFKPCTEKNLLYHGKLVYK